MRGVWMMVAIMGCGGPDDVPADGGNADDSAESGDTGPYWLDEDRDGDGYTIREGDCEDTIPEFNPGAEEICDFFDNDCDGEIDEGVTIDIWPDGDEDGWGAGAGTYACEVSGRYADRNGDCANDDASVYPGADDPLGDGIDQDCDGEDG